MRKLEPVFYCMCKGDCGKCPRPVRNRYMCIQPRAADCHAMSDPVVCPCLLVKGGGRRG